MNPLSHQRVHAMNDRLGSVGNCLTYTSEPFAEAATEGYLRSIHQLSELLQGNVIQTLVILMAIPPTMRLPMRCST